MQLEAGVWEGEPFAPDGASRPRLVLVEGFHLDADLNGDGSEEAVVLLSQSSAGSGSFDHLAVMGRRDGEIIHLGTARIGDRVQIRNAWIDANRIELEVVQAGETDAACCPSQKARRTFALGAGGLEEVSSEVTGKLSLADLGGETWRLTHFSRGEPAPGDPPITLVLDEGRLSGSTGCNRYLASIEGGASPGALEVTAIDSSKRACPEAERAFEGRYLEALEGVVKFGFSVERLALTSRGNGTIRTLLFTPEPSGEGAQGD